MLSEFASGPPRKAWVSLCGYMKKGPNRLRGRGQGDR